MGVSELLPWAAVDLSALLNGLTGAGFVAMLVAGVAAYRRIKSGGIVDDDAIIARLDRDNENVRKERDSLLEELAEERRKRWKAEEITAKLRRRLLQYIDEVNEDGS